MERAKLGCVAIILIARALSAQDAPEKWNLSWQATSIAQYHPDFRSPYEGENSLQGHSERNVSLTTTLFLGLRLPRETALYFDPEIAGGRGFSNVTGIANFPNGEMPRVASAQPTPYLARLYLMHDFGFGPERESFTTAPHQLAGSRPQTRYTIAIGRFTLTDFFDQNRYSHDPRTQFMGWSIMYNGAWDYPADLRGYTWGWMHEFHRPRWSVRYASAAMPRVANGLRFDRRLFRNRGDVFEGELRYEPHGHPGALRLLGYTNRANAGTYADAIATGVRSHATPDIISSRRNGTLKYGFGLNIEQELTRDVGIFGRLAWNDGKTESFAFTAIDRLLNIGASIQGRKWHRAGDTVGSALTVAGLSGVHANYLAQGGLDFLIGDGRLRYGTERIWESYYSAKLHEGFLVSIDAQRITDPAYNRDRGPVWAASLRLHVEIGKHP